MLRAVAGVVRRQIRPVDRAFRVADDEFCVLAPDQEADEALPLAERLCGLVDRSQGAEGPRADVTIGLASCPEHGGDAEALIERGRGGLVGGQGGRTARRRRAPLGMHRP